ncbi:MAG: hypothetical protein A2Y77_04325 [Planctomycetes bacterium RBG_13_62_9]|nr:MAG: hypothetical protein A2Y77_04325 [Planctomycetes bacterium RBG_13_62_9]
MCARLRDGRSLSPDVSTSQDKIPAYILCPTCGAQHALTEERIQGGEPETLKEEIEIMLLAEETMKMLDAKGVVARSAAGQELKFTEILNRQHGWRCEQCGNMIDHSYLVDEGRKRGISPRGHGTN